MRVSSRQIAACLRGPKVISVVGVLPERWRRPKPPRSVPPECPTAKPRRHAASPSSRSVAGTDGWEPARPRTHREAPILRQRRTRVAARAGRWRARGRCVARRRDRMVSVSDPPVEKAVPHQSVDHLHELARHWHGAQHPYPRSSRARFSDSVPVRPKPAPITRTEDLPGAMNSSASSEPWRNRASPSSGPRDPHSTVRLPIWRQRARRLAVRQYAGRASTFGLVSFHRRRRIGCPVDRCD